MQEPELRVLRKGFAKVLSLDAILEELGWGDTSAE